MYHVEMPSPVACPRLKNLDISLFDVLVNALWLTLCGLMEKVNCRWAKILTSTLEFVGILHFAF